MTGDGTCHARTARFPGVFPDPQPASLHTRTLRNYAFLPPLRPYSKCTAPGEGGSSTSNATWQSSYRSSCEIMFSLSVVVALKSGVPLQQDCRRPLLSRPRPDWAPAVRTTSRANEEGMESESQCPLRRLHKLRPLWALWGKLVTHVSPMLVNDPACGTGSLVQRRTRACTATLYTQKERFVWPLQIPTRWMTTYMESQISK